MPSRRRVALGGLVYHVCNRGSRKGELFASCEDYDAFERLIDAARQKVPMRILAYHLMRTHVHFLLWPLGNGDLSRFMHWLTSTHAKRWHRQRDSQGTGAVYQSRYVAVPVENDRHLLTAWRYIERNALTAGLVSKAEDWRWSSAATDPSVKVDPGPLPRPQNWIQLLNDLEEGQ